MMNRRNSIILALSLAFFITLLFGSSGADLFLGYEDSEALQALGTSWPSMTTGSNPWILTNVSDACYTWRGVGCQVESSGNNTLRVSSLFLESEGLQGDLPAALLSLTRLVNVSLARNALTGTIFANLSSLSNLVKLKLSHNNLTGPVPSSIGHLPNLESLELDGNQLSGILPLSLKNLAKLQVIDISHNVALSGGLFGWFSSFPHLRSMSAESTKLGGVVETVNQTMPGGAFSLVPTTFIFSTDIYNCENLTVLNAKGVYITGGVLPKTLGLLSMLEELRWAAGANIPGGDFPNITHLTNLRILDGTFSGCDLEIPEDLGNVTSLEYLSLVEGASSSYSDIVTIPESFGNLINLVHLDLSYNSLSGSLPASLANLHQLKTLDLRVNKLSGPILESHLRGWTSMENLNLLGNDFDAALPDAFDMMANLQVLILDGNTFTGNFPETLTNCTELVSISMAGCNFHGALPSSIHKLQKLNFLLLSANSITHFPDEMVMLENLKLIDLNGNSGLEENTFPEVLTRLSNLTCLIFPSAGFVGPFPDMSKMSSLDTLVLSANNFSGGFPESWRNLNQTLKYIDITESGISGTIPTWISSFKKLSFMGITNNHLNGTIPDEIADLTSLMALDLSYNELTGTVPSVLGRSHFHSIDLSFNQLNGSLPLSFNDPNGISPLSGLSLAGNHMSFCPSNLTRLPYYLTIGGSCDLSGQVDMPYDCGCQTDVFVNCTSTPQPLGVCIPCLSPPPSSDYPFECQGGVWVLISKNGTLTGGGITIGTSPVTIPGNLTVTTITYEGLPSGTVNVGGCAEVEGITVTLTQEDIDRLAALSEQERRKELLSSGTCEPRQIPISIVTSGSKNSCKSVKATSSSSQGTLSAIFEVTDRCRTTKWWAILIGVLLGSLLLVSAAGLTWYLIRRNQHKKSRSSIRKSSMERSMEK